MSTAKQSNTDSVASSGDRERFLNHLARLIDLVETWARQSDWSTRRIEKTVRDELGEYSAPGLLMQKEFCRVLLDPIGSSSFGDEGVVDLYRMPEYDDVARLYFSEGQWHIHFVFPGAATTGEISNDTSPPLSTTLFNSVLETMTRNAP